MQQITLQTHHNLHSPYDVRIGYIIVTPSFSNMWRSVNEHPLRTLKASKNIPVAVATPHRIKLAGSSQNVICGLDLIAAVDKETRFRHDMGGCITTHQFFRTLPRRTPDTPRISFSFPTEPIIAPDWNARTKIELNKKRVDDNLLNKFNVRAMAHAVGLIIDESKWKLDKKGHQYVYVVGPEMAAELMKLMVECVATQLNAQAWRAVPHFVGDGHVTFVAPPPPPPPLMPAATNTTKTRVNTRDATVPSASPAYNLLLYTELMDWVQLPSERADKYFMGVDKVRRSFKTVVTKELRRIINDRFTKEDRTGLRHFLSDKEETFTLCGEKDERQRALYLVVQGSGPGLRIAAFLLCLLRPKKVKAGVVEGQVYPYLEVYAVDRDTRGRGLRRCC